MNAGTGFGTVVIDGRRFQIVDLRLADSCINIEFHLTGPLPATECPITVYGEDGTGCWQFTPQNLPAVGEGECRPVNMTLRVGQVVRDPMLC